MSRKLSEDETLKFVQLYRDQECLWNIRCNEYKNKQIRTSALQQILKGMAIEGLTIEEVKAKIKSIRSTYYLEIDKIEKSKRSGAGGNIYVPRVKWFDELNSFIKNVAVRRITTDNMEIINNGADGIERTDDSTENQVHLPVSPQSENEAQSTPSSSVTPSRYENRSAAEKRTVAPSRSKRSKLSQMAVMIKDLKGMQDENLPRTEETNHDIFGRSVSLQLKNLSEEQAYIAQEKIQSILTQCKLADIAARKQTAFSSFSFQQSQSQVLPSMQQLQNSETQASHTQFTGRQYNQSSSQSSYPSSPASTCPLPEVSPSDTTSSSLDLHKDNSDFNIIFDEDAQATTNIIEFAFNNA